MSDRSLLCRSKQRAEKSATQAVDKPATEPAEKPATEPAQPSTPEQSIPVPTAASSAMTPASSRDEAESSATAQAGLLNPEVAEGEEQWSDIPVKSKAKAVASNEDDDKPIAERIQAVKGAFWAEQEQPQAVQEPAR